MELKNILKLGIGALSVSALMLMPNVHAALAQYTTVTIPTTQVTKDTENFINGGTIQYSRPSSVYNFVDEDGALNCVYASTTNLFWSKVDNNGKVLSTVSMPFPFDQSHLLPNYEFLLDLTDNFGNAVYYNGNLYVIYGQRGTKATSEYMGEVTMKLVKYNKLGQEVETLDMPMAEVNSGTDWKYGAFLPFFPNSNCSLTVSDEGILGCFFGTTFVNSHSGSTVFFVDVSKENMDWVSNLYYASEENKTKWANIRGYYNSHSMAQRIIATSDNGFLLADNADATYRGLLITKTLEEDNVMKTMRAKMIHYKEGSAGSNGYNNTYMAVGNILEVDDGYMYIGAMEPTMKRSFNRDINESWNIMAQKYDKDLIHKTTIQEMQLFDTPTRMSIGDALEPYLDANGKNTGMYVDSNGNIGYAYLKGTEVDYGIKWLSNLKNDAMVSQIRAAKIGDGNIVVIYQQHNMTPRYDVYNSYSISQSQYNIYYMIIDKDANIVQEPILIQNAKMSQEELYVVKDGMLYWTTADGYSAELKLNKVDLYNPLSYKKGDVNKDGVVNSTDAARVLQIYTANETPSSEVLGIGDMDSNGKLNSSDASIILSLY